VDPRLGTAAVTAFLFWSSALEVSALHGSFLAMKCIASCEMSQLRYEHTSLYIGTL